MRIQSLKVFQNKDFPEYPLPAPRPHAQKPRLVSNSDSPKIHDYAAFNNSSRNRTVL